MKTLLALATILAATATASAQPAPATAPNDSPCYQPCTIQPAASAQAQPVAVQPQVAAIQPEAAQPTVQPAAMTAATDDSEDNSWHAPVGRRFSHGFRLGWTYVENYDKPTRENGMSLKQEFGLKSPNMMLLGYEGFYRIIGHSWLNVLMVGNVTVAGLEQSKFIPAASGLLGFEFNRSFEIGVGVNLTPDPQAPSHMIAAAGYTPNAGAIQVPIHVFYVPDADGNNRYGATIGYELVTWLPMELRAITDDEVPAFRACMMSAFGDDPGEGDPDGDRRFRAVVPRGNAWAMFDGALVAGCAAMYDLSLGMPGGGSLGCAGLTMVGVRSTHRRRGILTQLMAAFDARARERGHAVAGLWASEAQIYGRFGFAVAAYDDVLAIERAHALTVSGGGDAIEWLEENQAREVLPDVYARCTAQRPGVLRRDAMWWSEREFLDAPFFRKGASKRRHVIATRDGAPVGYVQYRQRGAFNDGRAGGGCEIIELLGINTRAVASLWRYLCAIDLHPNVFWPNTPVDDPLHLLVDDPRLLTRKRADSLWLRVDDVARALAARTWGGELRLGIGEAVYDLPSGAKTSGKPDVTIAPRVLPAVLLGGLKPSELAAAGLASGDVLAADRVFASAPAPWCPEIF